VLSSSSLKADREVLLEGVSTSKRGPRLNHLFFVDDSLLFCRADIDHWSCLSNLPKSYEIALGKKLNTFKIAIFFSHNTPQEIRKKKKKKKFLMSRESLVHKDMTRIWDCQLWWGSPGRKNSKVALIKYGSACKIEN
jgi:hypothetical protein